MEQISKEFDSMRFLKQLYEIDKKIIERYEELKEELRQGASLEELDLLKLKLLIMQENALIGSLNKLSKDEILELDVKIEIAKAYIKEDEDCDIELEELFDFDLNNSNNNEIISRMWRIIKGLNSIMIGDYITYDLKLGNNKSKKIKFDRIELGTTITILEQYLLSKEQILGLKINYGLDDKLLKELYTKLNVYFIDLAANFKYLEYFTIYNRSKIMIDEEIIEIINLAKLNYLSQKSNEMHDSAAIKALGFIKYLATINIDNIHSIFTYIGSWAILEMSIKDCDLDSLGYVIMGFEEIECFEDERIRDEISKLLEKTKNRLK